METEIWWDCYFVLQDGTYYRGAISQEMGKIIARGVEKLKLAQRKSRVKFNVFNTLDDTLLECKDLWYFCYERELA